MKVIRTNLHSKNARYYNPSSKRFTQKDPIGFAGGDANLYRYIENDPINSTDPLGLRSCREYNYAVRLSELKQEIEKINEKINGSDITSKVCKAVGADDYLQKRNKDLRSEKRRLKDEFTAVSRSYRQHIQMLDSACSGEDRNLNFNIFSSLGYGQTKCEAFSSGCN